MQGVKWTEPKSNCVPGLTKEVSFFQLTNHPRLYCYDTPGVSLLKRRNDPERNAKLGVLKCMPDHIAGEIYLADYLLYRLNRDRIFNYVVELGLPAPTDDCTSWIFGGTASSGRSVWTTYRILKRSNGSANFEHRANLQDLGALHLIPRCHKAWSSTGLLRCPKVEEVASTKTSASKGHMASPSNAKPRFSRQDVENAAFHLRSPTGPTTQQRAENDDSKNVGQNCLLMLTTKVDQFSSGSQDRQDCQALDVAVCVACGTRTDQAKAP
eukprot:g28922.t1